MLGMLRAGVFARNLIMYHMCTRMYVCVYLCNQRAQAIRAIDKSLKLLPEHVAESTGIKRHRDNYQARVDKLT